MPKTAGAVRRKEKTPAEEHTKLTAEFCKPLCLFAGREVFSLRFKQVCALAVLTVWETGPVSKNPVAAGDFHGFFAGCRKPFEQ